MKRTILMTSALAAALALPAAAQQRGMGPGPGGALQPPSIEEMTTRLQLTPDQARQVTALRQDYMKATAPQWKAMGEIREAREAGMSRDSLRDMMQARRPQMEELRKQTDAYEGSLEKILTPDQVKDWQAWQQERREAARQQMRQRQGAPGW